MIIKIWVKFDNGKLNLLMRFIIMFSEIMNDILIDNSEINGVIGEWKINVNMMKMKIMVIILVF